MLLFREVKHTDVENVQRFLEEMGESIAPHLAYLHHSMLLENSGDVIGFGTYRLLNDDTARLMHIIIHPSYRYRGFGDGLIKSLLNTADLRGIKSIYAHDHVDELLGSFLDAIGFIRVAPETREANPIIEKDLTITHMAKLPEFFNTACKSKRK